MAAAADTADAGALEAEAEAGGSSLSADASQIIRRHAAYAAAGGLVAIPIVELAICTTIQLRMIAKLCDEYDVAFSENAVKAAVGALVGSVIPISSVGYSVFAAARAVPGVGQFLGILTVPALAGALTWAVGRVFAWHFASGGDLENFDADASKDQFKKEFEEGKRRAKGSAS